MMFLLAVSSLTPLAWAEPLITEEFDYPDGPLITVSEGRWVNHSGTAGQVEAANKTVHLTQKETEDVSLALPGGPYPANLAAPLFVRLEYSFSMLPSGSQGAYFAHFKEGISTFRGRLFASTNGAAPGAFRLGVSAGANQASAWWPEDLNLGSTYTLVLAYTPADATTTLWLNPGPDPSPGVRSTDTASATKISAFALRQALSSGQGMGAIDITRLVIGTQWLDVVSPAPPEPESEPESEPWTITEHPSSVTVQEGEAAVLRIVVDAATPVSFQWEKDGQPIAGATSDALFLVPVKGTDAGSYRVVVSDARKRLTSEPAWLKVLPASPPPPPSGPTILTSRVADLLNVDPGTTAGTEVPLWSVEGVVTARLPAQGQGGSRFFLQDGAAGLAIIESTPSASATAIAVGDRVRVVGRLGSDRGMTVLGTAQDESVKPIEVLEVGAGLPQPAVLDPQLLSNGSTLEALVGSLISVQEVRFDQPGAFLNSRNARLASDRYGHRWAVFASDAPPELVPTPVPAGWVTLRGVLLRSSFLDVSAPTFGLWLTQAPAVERHTHAPEIIFENHLTSRRAGDLAVNSFLDHALPIGDQLEIILTARDPGGQPLRVEVSRDGLPRSATWAIATQPDESILAHFTYRAIEADAGSPYLIQFNAANETSQTAWEAVFNVPTPAEAGVVITEFLARPTTDSSSPLSNPLRRLTPAPDPEIQDEFIELTNLSNETVDLKGWSIADSEMIRHTFTGNCALKPGASVVVFGGPLRGLEPQLPSPAFPASMNRQGLGLEDEGAETILLRNAAKNLVARIAYDGQPRAGSWVRFPDGDSPFKSHGDSFPTACSPGYHPPAVESPAEEAPAMRPIELRLGEAKEDGFRLIWTASSGRSYSVWSGNSVTGPFHPIAEGLTFPQDEGYWRVSWEGTDVAAARFYRVSSP
jgi:hypothetical protein